MKQTRCTRGRATTPPPATARTRAKAKRTAPAWRTVVREGVELKQGETLWRCRVEQ